MNFTRWGGRITHLESIGVRFKGGIWGFGGLWPKHMECPDVQFYSIQGREGKEYELVCGYDYWRTSVALPVQVATLLVLTCAGLF